MKIRLHISKSFVNKPSQIEGPDMPLSFHYQTIWCHWFSQADLNEQQRERFVSSMNIRQIAMPQYTYLQVKQLFLELFAVSRTGVADPNITHRKRSTF